VLGVDHACSGHKVTKRDKDCRIKNHPPLYL
jgi:hypothetical protein